ncbi:MAG: ferredoxin family protein [Deltaproteobacteria bacterium]|nr:ferredoxin family protein [Deltaproteobacteria bacterium]MBW1960173.1 ferredoxin family protein [Deltaproteobacteria bacterium]MBW2152016.1 ferredoxin family protein [Deltaproteobacteria bacterium]
MKKLHIHPKYCKGCLICVEMCPKKALKPSDQINSRGYLLPVENDMSRCTDCKLCEILCPDFAIAIEVEDE